jgi:hypothetical protein
VDGARNRAGRRGAVGRTTVGGACPRQIRRPAGRAIQWFWEYSMAIPGKGRPPWLWQVENKETGGVRFGNDFFFYSFCGGRDAPRCRAAQYSDIETDGCLGV